MFVQNFVVCCVLASVYVEAKDAISTTQKTELKNRFFGLENILGQIFHGPNYPGFGEISHHQSPGYNNQQNPQTPFHNWQNIQTPNQAQSNLNQYPQGSFNSQNSFPGANRNIQTPQQFPNQQQIFNQQSNMDPSQSITQGNFNTGFNPNLNTGTIDDIPSQNGINGNWNQRPGNQFQNQMENQNAGNQLGVQNQNGNQGFPNPSFGNQMGNQNAGNEVGVQNQNGNQGFQNQIKNQNAGNQFGSQNQNGNHELQTENGGNQNAGNQFGTQNQNGNQFQNQSPRDDDYNPEAILGKPVPVTTSTPDGIVFTDGCDTPTQKQCVQDCQSTTEYKPICGSNNVTYFNPGRFICARNCGIDVFVLRDGRCYR